MFLTEKEEEKMIAIRNYPRPTGVRDLRAFLGLAGFYQRFVKNFSLIVAPMSDLLKKDRPWHWDEHCEKAFVEVKKALTYPSCLATPAPNDKLVLHLNLA